MIRVCHGKSGRRATLLILHMKSCHLPLCLISCSHLDLADLYKCWTPNNCASLNTSIWWWMSNDINNYLSCYALFACIVSAVEMIMKPRVRRLEIHWILSRTSGRLNLTLHRMLCVNRTITVIVKFIDIFHRDWASILTEVLFFVVAEDMRCSDSSFQSLVRQSKPYH